MNKGLIAWHSIVFIIQMTCLVFFAYIPNYWMVVWCAVFAYWSLSKVVKEFQNAYH